MKKIPLRIFENLRGIFYEYRAVDALNEFKNMKIDLNMLIDLNISVDRCIKILRDEGYDISLSQNDKKFHLTCSRNHWRVHYSGSSYQEVMSLLIVKLSYINRNHKHIVSDEILNSLIDS